MPISHFGFRRRAVLKRFAWLAALGISRPADAGLLADGPRKGRELGPAGDEGAETERGNFTLPSGAVLQRDMAYGVLPAQKLDVYRPAHASGAPILVMVHGGGWRRGDKAMARVIKNKVTHWVGRGWVVISVNYRLLPAATPLVQADDLSRALGFVQSRASTWGADPAKVVLMGHSAGAHLVSMLTADPTLASRHGASAWLGTVALDSAAFDVEVIMRSRHLGLYDQAFGADPAVWREASPFHRLTGKLVAPMMIVCSSRRPDSCPQGQAFASKAQRLGGRVSVFPIDASHSEINEQVGKPGTYTAEIDSFMRSLGLS